VAAGSAGYSGTPLPQKLGIKPGDRIVALGAPWSYADVVAPLPDGAAVSARMPSRARFVHLFVREAAELDRRLAALDRALEDDGMIWISWPKKSSGLATDLTEHGIRRAALPLGLVDVKVCAVDEVWSGLKLVRRVASRGR
jgi:hypothetical protein